jgi:uncharacterized damage-inducible protein DinB
MLEYVRSLYRHQIWADEQLLRSVSANPAAQEDRELRRCLDHMAAAQRFYLARFAPGALEPARESEPPASWEQQADAFRKVLAEELAFLETLSATALDNVFELPRLGARFTLLEGMTQAVLHSQNHRGQCLTRLRELGSSPPTLDYILWARDHGPRPGS